VNTNLIDLTALETALADAIATLELEADANDPVLFEGESEPLAHVSLEQIEAGFGLDAQDRKGFTKREREARKTYMDKMRKRRARAAAKRTKADKVRDVAPLDQARVRAFLTIIGCNLLDVVTDTVIARYNRFRRVMGDVSVGDLANDTILALAESLARRDTDVIEVAEAALWLSVQPKPIDTAQDDAPARARMLMGAIVRTAGQAIVNTYRKSTCTMYVQTVGDEGKVEWIKKDVTLESLDYLTTMERATSTDVDALLSKHKADSTPKHQSSAPNRKEARVFARMVVDYAITARGLDWLTDLILDSLRTDGAFTWTKHTDEVWAGLGMPEIPNMKPDMKVTYAKRATRMAFAFLPEVIATAYEIASQPEVLAEWTYMYDTNAVTHTSDRITGVHMDQIPGLAEYEKMLDNGARVFLEGMQEGDAPIQLREGPDDSEWKRVFSSDESSIACAHGQRQSVRGMTKKAGKHPRRWQGEFCAIKGEGACEPIFHHGKADATPKHAMNRVDEILAEIGSLA
jgi:uncharacterized membrane protein